MIVPGPLANGAKAAYYTAANVAAGCAAVAAVGPGYSCNTIDAVDPLFPNALPRVLIINQPFVNSASQTTSGLDISATANLPVRSGRAVDQPGRSHRHLQVRLCPGAGQPSSIRRHHGPVRALVGRGHAQVARQLAELARLRPVHSDRDGLLRSRIKQVAADEVARTPMALVMRAPRTCTGPATISAMRIASSTSTERALQDHRQHHVLWQRQQRVQCERSDRPEILLGRELPAVVAYQRCDRARLSGGREFQLPTLPAPAGPSGHASAAAAGDGDLRSPARWCRSGRLPGPASGTRGSAPPPPPAPAPERG